MGYELYLQEVIKLTTKTDANVAIVKAVMEHLVVMPLLFEFYPPKSLCFLKHENF